MFAKIGINEMELMKKGYIFTKCSKCNQFRLFAPKEHKITTWGKTRIVKSKVIFYCANCGAELVLGLY